MSLQQVKIIDLPKILDERGNLSFFQSSDHIPFDIKRVYWVYDVPGGEQRGGHAFKEQHEVIVALSGSFNVIVNDGREEKVFSLNRSYFGLYIPKMIWRHLDDFSTNSLALVASDRPYYEEDYIREKNSFIQAVNDAPNGF
jgi:dTDP-4-dehydrorhamnose 3,5-epimerase-like enzyme